jgi:hypothetical protein
MVRGGTAVLLLAEKKSNTPPRSNIKLLYVDFLMVGKATVIYRKQSFVTKAERIANLVLLMRKMS